MVLIDFHFHVFKFSHKRDCLLLLFHCHYCWPEQVNTVLAAVIVLVWAMNVDVFLAFVNTYPC